MSGGGALGEPIAIRQGGARPLSLPTGETRAFLEHGDKVTFTASAWARGYVPIGFGLCRGVVRP